MPTSDPASWLGLTIGEWKDMAAAIASVLTAIGIVVGAAWAWRRFRRTSESRPKVLLHLDATWYEHSTGSAFVWMKVSAENEGGKAWWLVPESDFGSTYLAHWVVTGAMVGNPPPTGRFVDWNAAADPPTVDLLPDPIRLKPRDVWDEEAVTAVPPGSTALRAVAYLHVTRKGTRRFGSGRGTLKLSTDEKRFRTVEQSVVVVKPKEEVDADSTSASGLSDRGTEGASDQPEAPAPAAEAEGVATHSSASPSR
jgi:hypothetical protein